MVPRLIFYHVWSFHLMIFSLIFFRTYSKQRRPPPIGVRVWVNGPFLLRESEKMRDCAKTEKSVHDCAKLEKKDKFAWFACAWIKWSLLAWFDTPPPSWGASTTLQTNNLHRLLRVRPLFHKVVFLIGKKWAEKPVVCRISRAGKNVEDLEYLDCTFIFCL